MLGLVDITDAALNAINKFGGGVCKPLSQMGRPLGSQHESEKGDLGTGVAFLVVAWESAKRRGRVGWEVMSEPRCCRAMFLQKAEWS